MSTPFKRISAAIAIMMIISLSAAACGGSSVDGAQVIRDMTAAVAKINTTHSVMQVHIELSSPPIQGDITAEFWQQMPALFHGEIHTATINGLDSLIKLGAAPVTTSGSATPDVSTLFSTQNLPGSVLVADGNAIWLYTPANNHVYKSSLDTKNISLAQTQIFLQGLQGVVDRILAVSDVQGVGEEQVGGRDAYKLELTAKQGLSAGQTGTAAMLLMGGKVTLWVDKQLSVPLKLQYDNSSMGTVSITAINPDFNQTIDPAKFKFTPPANVTVVNLDTPKSEPFTLPQARNRAGYNLLVPTTLPDGALLVGVTQTDEPNTDTPTITERITLLNFQGNSSFFDITEAKSDPFTTRYAQQGGTTPVSHDNATTQSISVRGVTATGVTYTTNNQPRSLIYWTDKSGIIVSISGSLSLSDTEKVAESLK